MKEVINSGAGNHSTPYYHNRLSRTTSGSWSTTRTSSIIHFRNIAPSQYTLLASVIFMSKMTGLVAINIRLNGVSLITLR